MSGEARGEIPESGGGGLLKWIVGSVISAALVGAIGYHYSQLGEQARFEHEEQLRQAELEKQQKIEQAKIDTQHADQVREIFRGHEEQNIKLSEELTGQYYSLGFKNTYINALDIAIRYEGLDGAVFIRGWWTLKPNGSAIIAETRRPWFYFYAQEHAQDSSAHQVSCWDGVVDRTIAMRQRFAYIDDVALPVAWWQFNEPRTAKFDKVSLAQTPYGVFTYDLPCPDWLMWLPQVKKWQ
jgi:uncharacterized membrane protein